VAADLSLTIPADIRKLPTLLEGISSLMERHGFSDEEILDAELAVDEAVTNVIEHGYRGEGGSIDLIVSVSIDEVVIRLEDTAPPFDPTSTAPAIIEGDLEERPTGGLGVHLIKEVMDVLSYERISGKNVLIMKRLRKK
jgi:serine/threonine-protein kinase RsbW